MKSLVLPPRFRHRNVGKLVSRPRSRYSLFEFEWEGQGDGVGVGTYSRLGAYSNKYGFLRQTQF